jgi:hypothetical protein
MTNTTKFWRNKQRQFHRLDGPAVEYTNNLKYWYVNGKRHREDGPAVEWITGHKEWWVKGKLHRLDGPAVEWANGMKEWWLNGKKYSELEYPLAVIQFLLNCDKATAEVILKLYKN